MHNFRTVWEACKGLLKRIILTTVNTVRTTLFRTITIGVKTIATIGTEVRLNSKFSKWSWGFIANGQSEGIHELLRYGTRVNRVTVERTEPGHRRDLAWRCSGERKCPPKALEALKWGRSLVPEHRGVEEEVRRRTGPACARLLVLIRSSNSTLGELANHWRF